jgi:Ca2+-binding RTX toxin-like protein
VAVYQFSALSDGQAITFSPTADRLNFDQSAIAAADIRVTAVGSDVVITYLATGKDVTLNIGANQLAPSNITFANTSLALFGDNSPGTSGDAGGNGLTGGDNRDLIYGLGGNDSISGGAGSDVLIGGSGNDSIGGGSSGEDWLEGGAGNDTMNGGSGRDSLAFREAGAANADLVNDFVTNWDSLHLDGATLNALGANGRFASGDARFKANATGTATDSSDRVVFNTSNGQVLYDADGNGSGAAQLLFTLGGGRTVSASDFSVFGAPAGNAINGTEEPDELSGTAGDDVINGLGGSDTIEAWGGHDTVDGGAGRDSLVVGFNEPVVIDFRTGTASTPSETVTFTSIGTFGGSGLGDHITADDSGIWVHAADGDDTVIGGAGDDDILDDFALFNLDSVGEGDDQLFGGAGNDRIWTTRGDDTADGGAGNDHIMIDAWAREDYGNDVIDGGSGTDLLEAMFSGDVSIDLAAGTVTGGSAISTDGASVSNIEHVLARSSGFGFPTQFYNARVVGNSAANELVVFGGEIMLDGGAGNDTLTADGEADFVFSAAPGAANADVITAFQSGADEIHLSAAAHANLGAPGAFAAGDARFATNSTGTATDASDRIIFQTSTGQVWYDADGNGAGARALIATLQGGATLVATDIMVINAPSGSVFDGTSGDDLISGSEGNDTVRGFDGNDTLLGLEGADSLVGGDGDDMLWTNDLTSPPDVAADGAPDTLDGGQGNDTYNVGDPHDVILADPGGMDLVVSWGVNWTLGAGLDNLVFQSNGGNGTGNELDNEIVSAFQGGGTISGLGGNDILRARNRDSIVTAHGGDGNDALLGANDSQVLFGDAGDDLLSGGGAATTMTGGAGADVFLFNTPLALVDGEQITDFASGVDTARLDGNPIPGVGASGRLSAGDARFSANSTGTAQDASDRVIYNTANGQLWYDADGTGAGESVLFATLEGAPAMAASDIEVVNGSAPGSVINGTDGNDTLTGTAGDDTIDGFGGNDLFLAGATGGTDSIHGGFGSDSIEFKARATGPVVVDFSAGTISAPSGPISFSSIERVVTGNFNDSLTGNAAAQNLTGQGGSDTLAGAGGIDTIWGGGGADTFVFREMGTANADRISDWTSGSDEIHLDDAAFAAIGAMGDLTAGDARFKANSSGTATDTSDRVVFNTSTGRLYYDADGSGGGAAQLIATVQGGASVAATDISVI